MADHSGSTVTDRLSELVGSVREVIGTEVRPDRISRQVVRRLKEYIHHGDLLRNVDCQHDAVRYRQNILHVEEDGSFSIVALVWLPGQSTPVHDHVSWCVTGVYRGTEEEVVYRLERDEQSVRVYLIETGTRRNERGATASLTPPGDIHKVSNPGPETAISIHIYGADISKLGSSIRRRYDLDVRSTDRS